jgi:hypothetical protein
MLFTHRTSVLLATQRAAIAAWRQRRDQHGALSDDVAETEQAALRYALLLTQKALAAVEAEERLLTQ